MSSSTSVPVIKELLPMPDVEAVFLQLSQQRHCLFLDSSLREEQLGRYSFITADPFHYMELAARTENELDVLQAAYDDVLKDIEILTVPDLPPFQGGVAGMLSYDLGASLEDLPQPGQDEFQVPSLAVGFYDVVIAFDHHRQRAWIISHGLPEKDPALRLARAQNRIDQFHDWMREDRVSDLSDTDSSPRSRVAREALSEQFSMVDKGDLSSNFHEQEYLAKVQQAVNYIHAGDIFQVNLSQRLLHPATSDSPALYQRLRRCNPATFSGYFSLHEFQIVSASPERFLQVRQGVVQARPIKGTRARIARPEADLYAAADLQRSEKDRAENVMIVDLLRNDLSRVCEPDSVFVSELCRLEVYEFVQHLVSVVEGRLHQDASVFDLLRATFPGGSITGAPKVRAMEIIAELEPTARGPYCGSLGYIGFDGTLDMSILIRTITAGKGWWQFPVGGGIVAQSNPQREYQETWEKATGLLRALKDE
ncbi:MAG: anthranilate synthase component I family protein [Planctomycetota bacterium]|nr:anthranilate synthase component I family protein [Planctomycetota bacterium]